MQSQKMKKKQQNPSPPWQCLNPYILTKIFACLSLYDQLFSPPYVCRSWLSATLDNLFQNSKLDLRLMDTLEDENQLSRFTRLLDLAIKQRHDWVSVYLPSKNVLGYFGIVKIAEKTRNISCAIMPSDVALWSFPIFMSVQYWQNLTIFHARFKPDRMFPILDQLIETCKNIVELGIHGKITEKEVLRVIKGFPSLRVLDISESTVSSKALGILLEDKLKCLKELNILHCSIEDDDGKDIRVANYSTLRAFKKEMFDKASHIKSLDKFINCFEISCRHCKDIANGRRPVRTSNRHRQRNRNNDFIYY